jgi:hypothetical protein
VQANRAVIETSGARENILRKNLTSLKNYSIVAQHQPWFLLAALSGGMLERSRTQREVDGFLVNQPKAQSNDDWGIRSAWKLLLNHCSFSQEKPEKG